MCLALGLMTRHAVFTTPGQGRQCMAYISVQDLYGMVLCGHVASCVYNKSMLLPLFLVLSKIITAIGHYKYVSL